MKKKLILLAAILVIATGLVYTRYILTKDTEPPVIPVVQVVEERHGILFLPHYLAANLGFFAEQGIDVKFNTVQAGEQSWQLLEEGKAHVIIAGPGQALLTRLHRQGQHPIIFAEITQKDGAFFLARKVEHQFQWQDVKQRTIISGPATEDTSLVLESILRQHEIAPNWHCNVIENLPPFLRPGVFKSGTGSFLVAEEPEASQLVDEQMGTVVASLGKTAGKMPAITYLAYPGYLDAHPQVAQGLVNGLYKAQQWMTYHTSEEIAAVIEKDFPDLPREMLINVIDKYRDLGVWSTDPVVDKDSYQNLYNIVDSAGELISKVPYNKAVTNRFANQALKEVHYVPEDKEKPKPGLNWEYIKSLFQAKGK
ncbi:ABC transporter substrate-binding protein [Desulfofalx alkaliphila]|uniref:ABC transporter substrate-binding protein n=1 Tax=Desulfofalx alkaliphila TaxID=105483 RepID=UPI0004E1D8E3|nr:ABC transporter substrate-binding protein [Desulfofalx alkaliphila]